MFAGACAGITSATSTYPLDLVRTRLSVQGDSRDSLNFHASVPQDVQIFFSSFKKKKKKSSDPRYKGITDAVVKVYKEEGGVLGLYRGLPPTLMVKNLAFPFLHYRRLWLKISFRLSGCCPLCGHQFHGVRDSQRIVCITESQRCSHGH